MKKLVIGLVRQSVKALAYGLTGGLVVLITVFVIHLNNRPNLKVWHTADLDAEFTADSGVETFTDYLALETRLFEQLDERVYSRIEPEDRRLINRYHRGSLSDPGRWPANWNRSFEFPRDQPGAGVLLLHGMSDSPYSLLNEGQRLHEAGAWVVGLRIPGHGTAPSGLVEVRWQDMAAAVQLAVRHLRDKVGEQPIYLVGYSNGGALAVNYALSTLADSALPGVAGLVLISPAIGVSPLAVLAVWQARLGHLLGLEKLAWSDILPEYDPFKYGSFAVNAGDVVYRLTDTIQSRLEKLKAGGELNRFPPVLAFQSAVDATVSMPALVQGLFEQLPDSGHELVLFDINRLAKIEPLFSKDPKLAIEAKLNQTDLPFSFSLLTNKNSDSQDVIIRKKRAGERGFTDRPTAFTWPDEVYSLSHVALPTPANDPLYGRGDPVSSPGIHLGDLDFRGERGVLQVPASSLMRLQWNPFYPYIEQRMLEFVHLDTPSD